MTDVSNLDELANAIASSSAKIKNYAKAQAAATQSQELDIRRRAVVDVREFGAKCDGLADDTLAIRKTISAANASRMPTLISGICKVTSTINLEGGALVGWGRYNEGDLAAQSQLLAATAGMTVLTAGSLARIENLAIQGNNLADIGVKYQGVRPFTSNVEIFRCRKGSFVLAKTQNGCWINCFSQYSTWGFVLANGARNNNFHGCSAANYQEHYSSDIPWADTGLLRFVIDEGDADYGGSGVTTLGNDRNSFFGGIFEAAPIAIRFQNLSGFQGDESRNNMFYAVEMTADQILDTTGGDCGVLLMDSGSYTLADQETAWGIGTYGHVTFQGEPYFSGGANVAERGVTQSSNYSSLFLVDTDHYTPALYSEGGGTYSWDEAARKVTLLSGGAVQGVQIQPNPARGNIATTDTVAKLSGVSCVVTFTIEKVGSHEVIVYVPINGAPWRRQVGSYGAPGTYTLPVRIVQPDQYAISFANNSNAASSTVISGISMKATV